jgi:hypothetical protein
LVSSDTEEEDDVDDIEVDDDEDSDLEDLKVQIIVKSKNIKASIAKTLNIEPASYENVMEKINSVVQKTLRKKVISKDYIVSYKAVNARGPSNELEDESDFQEFIGEYKRVVLAGKKMSMIVMVRDKLTKKKKSHKVKFFYTIYCVIYKQIFNVYNHFRVLMKVDFLLLKNYRVERRKNHVPFEKMTYQKKKKQDLK